jgi:hypothetical protein
MSPPAQMSGGPESPANEHGLSSAEGERLREVSDLEQILEFEPSAVRSLVAVLSEPVATMEQLDGEPVSPLALRAFVTGLVERQRSEREAFLAALGVYKELTERLSLDLADAREKLAAETELARLEREQLVKEFLDRVDVLSAKISTSAARFTTELAEKDVLLQIEEQRVLAYAGQAAVAQSVIDDIHASNSWRLTAPIRLLSRLLAQRRRSEPGR